MKYAIIAATGHLGQAVIKDLLEERGVAPDEIVAIVRNREKAEQVLPQGIIIREAKLRETEKLKAALAGIDKVLFISIQPGVGYHRAELQAKAVEALAQAKVKQVIFTSYAHVETAASPIAYDFLFTENAFKFSGLDYVLVRTNEYLENVGSFIHQGATTGEFAYCAGEAKVGWALEREYAEGLSKILLADHPQKIYEFGGKPHSFADLAAAISQVSGQPVTAHNLGGQAYLEYLQKKVGLSYHQDDLLLEKISPEAAGDMEYDDHDLEKILGHKLTPFTQAVGEVLTENY